MIIVLAQAELISVPDPSPSGAPGTQPIAHCRDNGPRFSEHATNTNIISSIAVQRLLGMIYQLEMSGN